MCPDYFVGVPANEGDRMANSGFDPEQFIDQMIRKFRNRQRNGNGAGGSGGAFNIPKSYIIVAVLLIWLATGIYFVAPDENGVVVRFGEAVYVTEAGPHWHLPWPMERVYKPKVTQIKKVEIGFRTVVVGPPAKYRTIAGEALMLTGDENIVSLEFIVQYKIKDPINYLFNVRDPQGTLKDAAESAMREVIGKKLINDALTTGKEAIQSEAEAELQDILDSYKAGILIVTVKLQDVGPPSQVNDAFKDVINAQQDKERRINEAMGYRNDIIPKARGVAAQMLNEAEAYKESLIKRAEGEAERFNKILKEYRLAKVVTRRRLYLETMEKILPATKKFVLEGKAGNSTLPFLPIGDGSPSSKGGK